MSERKWVSPTGSEIVGTSDSLLATALISDINEDGTPEYIGESEIHWDTQETETRDGKILFVDDDGEEWTFDQLKQMDESDEDEGGGDDEV